MVLAVPSGTTARTISSAASSAGPSGRWSKVYDWASGQGYAGWQSQSSNRITYGSAAGLGPLYGLWLWALPGLRGFTANDYVEWRYAAPGTTLLSAARLSFVFGTGLVSSHCVVVGLRQASGTSVDQTRYCSVPSGGSQNPNNPIVVNLADPSPAGPAATTVYFRLEAACSSPCSRQIPVAPPFPSGAWARLLKADLTLTDTETPSVTPSGSLWDLRNQYTQGQTTLQLHVDASDPGSGVQSMSLVASGGGTLLNRAGRCDTAHRDPSLGGRLCSTTSSYDATVGAAALADGTNLISARAQDVSGNVGSVDWPIYVDRTPPNGPANVTTLAYDPSTQVAAIGWDESTDPPLSDGFPGSGVAYYRYRADTGSGFGGWVTAYTPEVSISPVSSSGFTVEVVAVDKVGNTSSTTSATVTTQAAGEPGLAASGPLPDQPQPPTLTSGERASAVQITTGDTALTTLTNGAPYAIQDVGIWSENGTRLGAVVTLGFASPTTIQGEWPTITDATGNPSDVTEPVSLSSYQTLLANFSATNVQHLFVWVSLPCNKVLAIAPGSDDAVDVSSATQASTPTPLPSCAIPPQGLRKADSRSVTRSSTCPAPFVDGWLRNITVISEGPDAFYNYDFGHSPPPTPCADDTEGPVDLVFWGQAREAIDTQLYPCGSVCSATEYGLLKTGSNPWVVYSDEGYKSRLWCGLDDHYRVYHDAEHPHFNPYWGYYFIGTAHRDFNDIPAGICGRTWYGDYRKAEQDVADEAVRVFGTDAVQRNKIFLWNPEYPHWDQKRTHFRVNDGKATKIRVCLNEFFEQEQCGRTLQGPPGCPTEFPSTPTNDALADRAVLAGPSNVDEPHRILGTLKGATVESGEPPFNQSFDATASVWYDWTPPISGDFEMTTYCSPPPLTQDGTLPTTQASPPSIEIWDVSGLDLSNVSVLGDPVQFAWNNNFGSFAPDFTISAIRFQAQAGTHYLIRIALAGGLTPPEGDFALNYQFLCDCLWRRAPDARSAGSP